MDSYKILGQRQVSQYIGITSNELSNINEPVLITKLDQISYPLEEFFKFKDANGYSKVLQVFKSAKSIFIVSDIIRGVPLKELFSDKNQVLDEIYISMILREIFSISSVYIRKGLKSGSGLLFEKANLIITQKGKIRNFNFFKKVTLVEEASSIYKLCKFLALNGDDNDGSDDNEGSDDSSSLEKGYFSRAFRDFIKKLREFAYPSNENGMKNNVNYELDYQNLMSGHKFIKVSIKKNFLHEIWHEHLESDSYVDVENDN